MSEKLMYALQQWLFPAAISKGQENLKRKVAERPYHPCLRLIRDRSLIKG